MAYAPFKSLHVLFWLRSIHIKRVGKPESVPHAHTCSLTLDLPPYTSRAQLKRQLRLAFELMSKFEGLVD